MNFSFHRSSKASHFSSPKKLSFYSLFARAITELETYIEGVFAQGTKSLKENKAKAFNTLRSKVRKGNKDYAQQVLPGASAPSSM